MKHVWEYLLLFLVALLLMPVLSGCSSTPETVPDSLVEMVVSDESEAYLHNPECVSITHNPDKSTHLDTVEVEMVFYDNYNFYFECTYVFQYSKDSDTWSCIRSGELNFLRKE